MLGLIQPALALYTNLAVRLDAALVRIEGDDFSEVNRAAPTDAK